MNILPIKKKKKVLFSARLSTSFSSVKNMLSRKAQPPKSPHGGGDLLALLEMTVVNRLAFNYMQLTNLFMMIP